MKSKRLFTIVIAVAIAAYLAASMAVPAFSSSGPGDRLTQDEATQEPEAPVQLPYFEPTAEQPASNGQGGLLLVVGVLIVIVIFVVGLMIGRRRPKEKS